MTEFQAIVSVVGGMSLGFILIIALIWLLNMKDYQ